MASEPEKDDLAEEETDDAEDAPEEKPAAKAPAAAKSSAAKASGKTASTSKPAVAKKKPVVVEEEDEDDEEEDDEDDDEDAPPPPPKKVVKKKTKKGKAAVATTKAAKPTVKRRKVGPKKPAKAFLPHAVVALALGYADSRMDADKIPFHPLAVIGIILLVYAFINIGSANEVGTENALTPVLFRRGGPTAVHRSNAHSARGPRVARSVQRPKISLASARRPRSRSAVPHTR